LHKKTWSDDESTFNLHLNAWRFRKLSSIRKSDVFALHGRIGRTSGPYAANRVVELLSTMFNRARDWGWSGENPTLGIKAFPERKRDRFLQPDELKAFFQALAVELNGTARDLFVVCLLTGARRGNVAAMRWSELDLTRGIWKIPETKNGESLNVPLSIPALQVLQARKPFARTDWVFPGKGKTAHMVEPKAAWKRIVHRMKIDRATNQWNSRSSTDKRLPFSELTENDRLSVRKRAEEIDLDLRLHDLRRTLGSWQAGTGASLPIIGRTLGHKSLAATQIYARLMLDPVRSAIEIATNAMLAAGEMQPAGLLPEGK
jgi:integrase